MPKRDVFQENAEYLVSNISRALIEQNKPLAVRFAYEALKGLPPPTPEQLERAFTEPMRDDTTDRVWELGARIFKGQPAQWRMLVGRLVKVCGAERAFDVLADTFNKRVADPKTYIMAAVAKGSATPVWKLTDSELVEECIVANINTGNRDRKDLEARLEAFRKTENFARATTCTFGLDLLDGA